MHFRPVILFKSLAFLAAVPWGVETARAQGLSSTGANPRQVKSAAYDALPDEFAPAETYTPPETYSPRATATVSPSADCARPSRWWRFWHRRQEECDGQADGAAGYACQSAVCGAPVPLGASLSATMATQIQNAEAAQMVLYHFDFCPGDSPLTYYGRRKLYRIAPRLAAVAAPLLIQPTGDTTLDAERRARVLEQLAAYSFPVASDRVRTAFPPVRELEGVDAINIEQKLTRMAPASSLSGTARGSSPANAQTQNAGPASR